METENKGYTEGERMNRWLTTQVWGTKRWHIILFVSAWILAVALWIFGKGYTIFI